MFDSCQVVSKKDNMLINTKIVYTLKYLLNTKFVTFSYLF